MSSCKICKRALSNDANSLSYNCGGDCRMCMAEAGDPGCISSVMAIVSLWRSHDDTDLAETCRKKSELMERAIEHLDGDEKRSSLTLVMGWMSIADIEGMVNFWDERMQ